MLPVWIHDRIKSVGDREDCAVFERLPDGCLNQVVCFQVDSRGGFVKHKHASLAEKRSGKADQLTLSNTAKQILSCALV